MITTPTFTQHLILNRISEERRRQDTLFGPLAGFDDDSPDVRLAVLMKKVGDTAVAYAQRAGVFRTGPARFVHHELLEVAAVAVALLEAEAHAEQ